MRIKRLPILASVLLLAACTADIQPPVRQILEAGPQAQDATDARRIHYCVTVSDRDDNTTRASLNKDGKYVYSASDMLFIRSTGEDEGRVYGALILNPKDAGKSSGVTFEGDLQLFGYGVDEEPSADMPLEAVLVGSHDQLYEFDDLCEQITGLVWPQDDALSTSVAQAVESYSTLTAQSTYGQQSFQLSQGSCFVDFSVTLDDETEVDKEIGAYVWTDADLDKKKIRSGTVTTFDDGEGHIKANFVAAFPGGTVLDGAVVGLGGRNPIDFGGSGTTLEANKIYHVNRIFTRQPETISFDKPSLVKSHPDGEFQIAVNNSGDGKVTYASEDEDVATVAYDELLDMWLVTITGAGETDLKATVTDGENSIYNVHTVSCHLTVKDPVPLAEVTADKHIGWVIGTDGKAYVTVSGIFAAEGDQKPLAMIGYVGAPGSADASSNTYRGLAIALNDAATSVAWTSNSNIVCTGDNACDDQNFPKILASMTGISNTAYLADLECRTSESDTHTHAAAAAAHAYVGVDKEGFTLAGIGCSPWFLPSTGQWFKVLQACGVATDHWTTLGYCPDVDGKTIDDVDNHCADNYTAIESLMTAVGSVLGERYWTSTERTGKRFAFYVDLGRSTGVGIMTWSKTASCNVRSFIAF